MAILGTRFVTLADVAKSDDKSVNGVAEVLLQSNAMLKDIMYKPMNDGTTHIESIRSALPAVYYRKANQAIPPSKTTIEERSFSAAHIESKSQMDAAVAERGGKDRVAWNRWNQAQGHIQAQGLELANLMIYGSPVSNPLKVPGFFDIYSTLTPSEPTSKQIVDAGGTGSNNCSILLVHWGEQSVFGIVPEGTQAGLQRIDRSKGGNHVKIQAYDLNGQIGDLWGYEEQFMIDHGLVVKDYRQAGRIANIDVNNLKSGVAAADLIDLMISMSYKIYDGNMGKGVWYVNRTIEAFLHKQALTKVGSGAGLTYQNYQGEQVLMFLGRPVRRSDALLSTEARVV